MTGSASFYQNPFTGTNSKYRIDLTGLTAGDIYVIGLQADCNQNMVKVGYNPSLADPQLVRYLQELQTGTAPGSELFKVYGQVDDHNIDGADSKTLLTNLYLVVRKDSATGDVIGCTDDMLS